MTVFSAETLAYLRSFEARVLPLPNSAPLRIPLTDTLRAEIATGLGLVLPADLTDVPLRWIVGDTAKHEDSTKSGESYERTYIAYLSEGATGTLFVDGADPVTIASNVGASFNEGATHWTEGATPRLVLGPMNERGESVGNNGHHRLLSVALSANGTNLVAAAIDDPQAVLSIYTSTDAGLTWIDRLDLSSGQSIQVASIACSADGATIIGSGPTVGVWLSTDAGVTWAQQTDLDASLFWGAVACSADGTTLVACESATNSSGVVWIRKNGGVWAQQQYGPTDRSSNWYAPSVAIDASGITIIVCASNALYKGFYAIEEFGGWIWNSTGGPDSAFQNNPGQYSVALSADGQFAMVADGGAGNVYTGVYSDSLSYAWSLVDICGGTTDNWFSCAMDASGNNLVVTVNSGTTNDIWRSNASGDSGSWTALNATNRQRNWLLIRSSADGSKLVGVSDNYDLYYGDVSSGDNTTVEWRAIPFFVFEYGSWNSIAVTPNSRYIVAGEYNGDLFVSSDSGYTWRDIDISSATHAWSYNFGLSNDGLKILVGDYTSGIGELWISLDGGGSWASTGVTSNGWSSCTMDASGTNMLAMDLSPQTFFSTDGGATWNTTDLALDDGQVAMSADGQHAVAVAHNYDVFIGTFTAGGWSWTDLNGGGPMDPFMNDQYTSCAISANGKVVACCSFGGFFGGSGLMWLSQNYGAAGSWSSICENCTYWSSVSLSADGTHLIASTLYNDIWLYTIHTATWTNISANSPLTGRAIYGTVLSDNLLGAITTPFMSFDYNALFISRNGGWSWKPVSNKANPNPALGAPVTLNLKLLSIA